MTKSMLRSCLRFEPVLLLSLANSFTYFPTIKLWGRCIGPHFTHFLKHFNKGFRPRSIHGEGKEGVDVLFKFSFALFESPKRNL
jgi:hypothetical protein